MNRIYRLVWNRARGCLVVASEIASARGRHGRTATRQRWLLALPLGLAPLFALAASPAAMAPAPAIPATPAAVPAIEPSAGPSGGQVTAGSGSISQSGLTTTIDQHSRNLSLSWQTFDIGADSTVNFVQPSAQSIAVNRIADPNGSVILGRLNANGQVFLINPNGVLFGQGAQVNAGGLVASALDVSDSELGSDTLHFRGNGNGKVVNRGKINTANGYVALLGPQVSNQGTLGANGGTAALAGGNAITLSFDGNRLLDLQVDQSALNALAENRQLIVADGGQVLMSAGAKDTLLASTVNNAGVIQARTVANRDGRIVLLGGMQAGTANVAGTLDASAPGGGHGGFIETSAAHVRIDGGARVTTRAANGANGTWLIDPQDFTIAASGGDMTGSTLSSQLGNGNVAIESSSGAASGKGDIFVNDAIGWNANTLTLTAARNIDINAAMTAGGTAGLALNPATANGADAAVGKGNVNVMPGLGRVDFTGTGNSLHVNGTPYTLITGVTGLQGINGDLGGHYALANDIDASATAGWNPDGSGGFAGFSPLGVDYYAGTSFTGVFDGLGHTIDGLTINRPTIDNVGLFGATADDSVVRNVGLQGGSTRGRNDTGALVGSGRGLVSHAYATGNVRGGNNVGGLIGYLNANVDHMYATGDIEGSGNAGGLIGFGMNASLKYSYATGHVSGGNAGGLAGAFESFSPWYSYATGDVTGTSSAGGLVGEFSHGTVWYSYATGRVTDGASTGGLIGDSQFTTVIRSYWDKDSTGQSQACGGAGAAACSSALGAEPIGLGTADAFRQASYGSFNFNSDWYMVDGETRPFLRFEYATSIGNAHQLQLIGMDLAAHYTLAGNIDASVADGSRASGMWSSRGFSPIGTYDPGDPTTAFTGSFDGQGHAIAGLTIDRPTASHVGLFGANGGTIRHVGLLGGRVVGDDGVGSLAGYNSGSIGQAYATGTASGSGNTGGLVGWNDAGTVTQSYATGKVTGGDATGGLVGNNGAGATITQSYAAGAVDGSGAYTGGLVGANAGGTIAQSYATGAVAGSQRVGGLAGINANAGTVMQSYATGAVTGSTEIGGLTGYNADSSTITQSYATGAVSGTSLTGGLVGRSDAGTVVDSYWNKETTGQDASAGGGSALTSGGMTLASHFAGWDIATAGGSNAVWRIYEGHTAPLLRAFMTAASGSAGNAGKTYDGAAFGDYGIAIGSVAPGFWLPGTAFDPSLVSGQAHSDAVNAGNYALDGAGLYSSQMGYDLDIAPGMLVIDPKALTIALAGNLDKVYDGNADASLAPGNYLLSGFVGGEGATVSHATGHYDSKNVADAGIVTVTLSGNSFDAASGTLLSNYVLPATVSGTGHITPLGITVDATAGSKVYDATTNAAVALSSGGVVAGDAVSFDGTGSFADKNAGTGKTVTVNGIHASGADAGNYAYNTVATGTADITPATLTYRADAAQVQRGQVPGSLGGTVAGLIGDDTLAEATTGTLTWHTPATGDSPAGRYAIEGGGLSALNYTFVQASGNAAALRVTDGGGAAPVDVPGSVASTIAGLQQPDDTGKARAPYAPDVHIVSGGVRLP